jgi:UPF0716 protein FxsA
MRLFFAIILLAFPVAEIYLLIILGQRYGWWLILYLVVITYLGLQLIRGEKQVMSAKVMQSLKAGGNPMKTIMGSARNMVAGILLVIPGIMTDVIAVILLLIPIQQPKVSPKTGSYQTDTSGFEANFKDANTRSANDDVIEGEFEEIIEPSDNVVTIDNDSSDKDLGK